MKNCGQTIHDEVASKQTMEELKDLFKVEFSKIAHFCIYFLAVKTFFSSNTFELNYNLDLGSWRSETVRTTDLFMKPSCIKHSVVPLLL